MDFIQDYALLIIVILLILLLLSVVKIYIQNNVKPSKKKRGSSSTGTVSKGKHKKVPEKYNQVLASKKVLEDENKKICLEITKLKAEINKLRRDNAELNKLLDKESAHLAEQKTTRDIVPADSAKLQTQEVAGKREQPKQEQVAKKMVLVTTEVSSSETITAKEESPVVSGKEVVMYASFPRSAGSSIYFSDLTENLADDSFFELKISNANGKATFKPLDFMKIRNYDPAMAAMLTNGVKPNVASTVLGIEPGKAHIEGKDWIIDNPAKIKLA